MKKIITLAIAAAAICPAIAVASDTERGEAAVAYVGPYDNPKSGSESVGAILPFDMRYDHSYCQTLYTSDMLTGLNQIIDGKPSKSEISELTFKMYTIGGMLTGQKNITVYVQNVDATSFATVNNEKQWFTVDTSISGTARTEDYEYTDVYGQIEYSVPLAKPFVYEGKSLLVTWMIDGELEDIYSGYLESQTFMAADGQTHSGIISSDLSLGMQSGNMSNSSKDLPVLKINYTPLFEETGIKPVLFDNVEVKLEGVNLSPACGSYYSAANAITVTFDVNDPTDAGEYEIFMGTQSLGTLAGTSGTIRFFEEPKGDIVLRIEPQSDDAIGTSYTIAKADVDALFPAPGARYTGSYALYSEYDLYNDMEGTMQGAAQFQMTSTAPVARMWADPQNPVNSEQMYRGGTEYPDNLMALVPRTANANDYSDMKKNGGIFAVYAPYLAVGKLRNDVMQWPESVTITVSLTCVYPLVSKSVPTLLAGKADFDSTDQALGTVTTIQRAYNQGTTWDKSLISAVMPVDAAHFKQDVIYVDRLRVQRDLYHGTLQFFAPRGLQIQYKFVAGTRADGDWTVAPTNPWTFYTKECGAGTLTVRTVNPNTGEQKEMMIFDIDENGGFMSSLQTVNVAENAKGEIFDLQGRRLAAPVKGLNIINGKKVIR